MLPPVRRCGKLDARNTGREAIPILTRAIPAILLAAALLVHPGSGDEPGAGLQPAPGWQFKLPEGAAQAGEAVFIQLGCPSCHLVAGRSYAGQDLSREPVAPTLGSAQAALTREYLAERLISYDRFLPGGHYKATYSRSDGSSRMGNFNDVITVRQLIDLVEFIKSIRE